jgi:hypothetical protein
MRGTRVTSTLGAAAVAGIAAWASWTHMVHVALRFGERAEVAYVLPLSVDGLLVVASAAMVDDKTAGRRPRTSAKVAFIAGVAASIAANITAAQPSVGARAVAAWPAVALLLVVELMTRTEQADGRRPGELSSDKATPEGRQASAPAAISAKHPATPTNAFMDATTGNAIPVTAQPAQWPSVGVIPSSDSDARIPAQRVTPQVLTSRAKVERAAAGMPGATRAEIAAKAGVSESTVRRYLPKPTGSLASPSPAPPAEIPQQQETRRFADAMVE